MAAVGKRIAHAPSKAAILSYLEKKKKEEEAAKEKRFAEMLNPYRKFGKKTEPDEDFVKAQKKKERMLKKKEDAERKLREKMDKERLQKQNQELTRLAKEQEEHRAMEEKKRQQDKAKKQAIFGKPVDKKMQEYLERIKAAREAEKTKLSGPEARRAAARKREEEKLLTSAKVRNKGPSDIEIEREREKRILENMRRQQNKSINGAQNDGKSTLPSSKVSNGDHVGSKRSTVTSKPSVSSSKSSSSSSSYVTSTTLPKVSQSSSSSTSASNNRIPKIPKSRVNEYSPTRPSINEKSHDNRKSKSSTLEYSPTKVTKTKEGTKSDAYRQTPSSPQYKPTPKSTPVPKSGHSSVKENGYKVKSRSEQSIARGGGDQIARTSSSFEDALNPPAKRSAKPSDNKKSVRGSTSKTERDIVNDRTERLERERKLEAERELERQRAKNRELEEQLAALRREREAEQERKQVANKPKPALPQMPSKRRPIASNKILPPIGLTYRRGMNYQPVYEDDDEEEEDEEMRDFIDDGDDLEAQKNDVSQYIREIFGYDKRKYAMIDDDDIEEASFAQQMKEEMESAKAGLLEDLEDIRKEEEEKKRKAKLKKRRQFIDDSDED